MNDKGLLFFTLSLLCFWLVADDLVGKKRLSNIAGMLTPDLPSVGDMISDKAGELADAAKDKVEDATKETAKDLNKKAPDVFFDPNDKKDKQKAKDSAKDKVYNKFVEKYGIGGEF